MSIKETIRETFSRVFSEQVDGHQLPTINDDLVLLESGLDSMRFGESTFRLIPWLKTYSKILLKDIRFYRRKGVFIPYDYL